MKRSTAGVPRPQRWAVTTVGGRYNFEHSPTIYLQLIVHAGTVRLYFTKEAFDADVAGGALLGIGEACIEVSATDLRPYEGPIWVGSVYLRALSIDAEVTLVPFMAAPGPG